MKSGERHTPTATESITAKYVQSAAAVFDCSEGSFKGNGASHTMPVYTADVFGFNRN